MKCLFSISLMIALLASCNISILNSPFLVGFSFNRTCSTGFASNVELFPLPFSILANFRTLLPALTTNYIQLLPSLPTMWLPLLDHCDPHPQNLVWAIHSLVSIKIHDPQTIFLFSLNSQFNMYPRTTSKSVQKYSKFLSQ